VRVREFNLIYAGREQFDDGADLSALESVLADILRQRDYVE
jgi:hypothetical protein